MNTLRALALAAPLALPAPATAADAGPPPTSLALGYAFPAFSAGADGAPLPRLLVLSLPLHRDGVRVEPEFGLGSGWTEAPLQLAIDGPVVIERTVPVKLRWYRVGVTVAPAWAPVPGAAFFAGGHVAAALRREAIDSSTEPSWRTDLEYLAGGAAGGEVELAPGIALGAALRVGWTFRDEPSELAPGEDADFFGGEALLSLRAAL